MESYVNFKKYGRDIDGGNRLYQDVAIETVEVLLTFEWEFPQLSIPYPSEYATCLSDKLWFSIHNLS